MLDEARWLVISFLFCYVWHVCVSDLFVSQLMDENFHCCCFSVQPLPLTDCISHLSTVLEKMFRQQVWGIQPKFLLLALSVCLNTPLLRCVPMVINLFHPQEMTIRNPKCLLRSKEQAMCRVITTREVFSIFVSSIWPVSVYGSPVFGQILSQNNVAVADNIFMSLVYGEKSVPILLTNM